MEARLLRICVIAAFGNIRFDSNTIAPRHHRTYDFIDPSLEPIIVLLILLIHLWNQLFQGASV
jgi:hypothetical protein